MLAVSTSACRCNGVGSCAAEDNTVDALVESVRAWEKVGETTVLTELTVPLDKVETCETLRAVVPEI